MRYKRNEIWRVVSRGVVYYASPRDTTRLLLLALKSSRASWKSDGRVAFGRVVQD